MADIPTVGMKDTVVRIIETLGEPMDLQRRNTAGEWEEATFHLTVYRQPAGSIHTRDHSGIGADGCHWCFAGSGEDILPGDRTAFDGTWRLVTRLLDRGTHLEFLLEETAETAG